MKILVTGAKGFIGKNLVEALKLTEETNEILACDVETTEEELDAFCRQADFVFHLAGVNRAEDTSSFESGNIRFTEQLLLCLKKHENKAPVLISSSVQAENTTPYGVSKRAAEEVVRAYGITEKVPTYIYRLPNVFGKWSRPNYNSVVATFCYNISRNMPIRISDPEAQVSFVYIDDVVSAFIEKLHDAKEKECHVTPVYSVTVGKVAKLLFSFKKSRKTFAVPNVEDAFAKKLYATYLSYLPETEFSYSLIQHADKRGVFAEFLKAESSGQISVNSVCCGYTKGNHWHKTKTEKFLAVAGQGEILLRKIGTSDVLTYPMKAGSGEVVDIPPGYTHAVKNTGNVDFVTVIWASEVYDPNCTDTYYEEV